MEFSFSKLSKFEKCPRLYYWDYIEKLGLSTPSLEFGKQVHEAIAKFIATGEVDSNYKDFITWRVVHCRNTGADMIESPVRFQIDGVDFVGIVDAVLGNNIVDWKTNWLKNADPKQLYLYSYALKQNGLDIKQAIFHYLRYHEDVVYDVTESEINKALDWAKRLIQQIIETTLIYEETGAPAFEQTTDYKQCMSCAYKEMCHKVNTHEEVVALALEIEKLRNELELKEEMLKNYIAEFGEVVTETGVWRLTPVNTWELDTKKTAEYIRNCGYDPLEILTCTATNLKKKLGVDDSVLETLGTKKVSYRLAKQKLNGKGRK